MIESRDVHKRKVRTALVLVSISLAFFFGVIAQYWL
jgi:hypothetical protein